MDIDLPTVSKSEILVEYVPKSRKVKGILQRINSIHVSTKRTGVGVYFSQGGVEEFSLCSTRFAEVVRAR